MLKIQKLDLLTSLYITCICLAELMGSKTFPLPALGSIQLNASVAIFVFPLIFTINDIITEVYGKEKTRSIIQSGFLMIVLLVLFTTLATVLPPSTQFSSSEAAYDLIFHQSIRLSLASLTAFAFAEILDVMVFVRIRKSLGASKLWLRNNASNFISQFFDTAIFMTLAFTNLANSPQQNITFLLSLIIPYWLLKCAMSVIETPFTYIGVRWLKSD